MRPPKIRGEKAVPLQHSNCWAASPTAPIERFLSGFKSAAENWNWDSQTLQQHCQRHWAEQELPSALVLLPLLVFSEKEMADSEFFWQRNLLLSLLSPRPPHWPLDCSVLWIRHSYSHSILFGSLLCFNHTLICTAPKWWLHQSPPHFCRWFAGSWHTGNSLAKSQFQSMKRTLLVLIISVLGCLLNNLIKHYSECSSEPQCSCASRRRKEPADRCASQEKTRQKNRNPFRKSI